MPLPFPYFGNGSGCLWLICFCGIAVHERLFEGWIDVRLLLRRRSLRRHMRLVLCGRDYGMAQKHRKQQSRVPHGSPEVEIVSTTSLTQKTAQSRGSGHLNLTLSIAPNAFIFALATACSTLHRTYASSSLPVGRYLFQVVHRIHVGRHRYLLRTKLLGWRRRIISRLHGHRSGHHHRPRSRLLVCVH